VAERLGQRRTPPPDAGNATEPARAAETVAWPRALAGTAFTLRTIATVLVLLVALDAAFLALFPTFPRLADNFSPAYLEREARQLAASRPVVVLGDSVLWGYRLPVEAAAVTQLRARDPRWVNLAYEGGSAANTYAMLRILDRAGVVPRAVVFNVNLKEFNSADSAYDKLYPGVERLAWPLLDAADRAKLEPVEAQTVDARLNAGIESIWHLYAMRSDLREALFADQDAAHALQDAFETWNGTAARKAEAHRPTPDKFEGTYDLSPLDDSNTAVYFLRRTAGLLRGAHVPAYAILTPANHRLLHEFIDVPEYRAQLRFVTKLLATYGVRVLDYDRAFAPAEFLDNDHLTPAGNLHLARLLERDVAL
jgi:hypothetical protein